MIDINDFSGRFFCKTDCILDNGKGTQSQEVHFQQPQFFQCRHRKLRRDRTVAASGERHKLIDRFLTDHDPGCMHGGMTRQTFQSSRHIDQLMHLRIFVIDFFEFRISLKCFIYGNADLSRDHFCD